LTVLSILIGGLAAVLGARARLAADAGSYWAAWSFRVHPVVAAQSVAEIVLWPFVAGLAAASGGTAVVAVAGGDGGPRLLTSFMVGLAAGGILARRGSSDRRLTAEQRAMATLLRRQDQTLDRLAHEGLDEWLGSLSPQALEKVARDAVRRNRTRYGHAPPTGSPDARGEALKVTALGLRNAFLDNPDDDTARDDFRGFVHGLIREQRFVYRRKERRQLEALGG
jgi:hypothetical protein